MTSSLWVFVALAAYAQAYWLMGIEDFITTERIDPVVSPGKVSGHVHSVLGGSNFRFNTTTDALRQSDCTSIPIPEDKSNYWFPHLYFQWSNGSFSSLNGGAVIYYLFSDTPGTTTAFPDNFRMLSGDPTLRTYDPNSYAQQAVTFLCLDFNGVSTRYNELPAKACPSGIRAQINFPSCWDGKNLDSADHKSHVAFLSGGPDSGTCSDPKFPVTLPRIFIEVYWASNDFEAMKSQAMNPSQPFVYSYGDPTGYGYHADFINGWDKGVLQNAVDKCHCNPYGDPTCCVDQGIFHMNKGQTCRITKSINEQTTGTLLKLPGNNPVQPAGQRATMLPDNTNPQLLSPVFAYTGDSPTAVGSVVPGSGGAPATVPAGTPSSSVLSVPSSSNAPKPVTSLSSLSSIAVPSPATSSHPILVEPPHTSSVHATVPTQASATSTVLHSQVPSTSVAMPAPSSTPAPSDDEGDDDDLPECDDDPEETTIFVPPHTTAAQPTSAHASQPTATHAPSTPSPDAPSHNLPSPSAPSPNPDDDDLPECDDEPEETTSAIIVPHTTTAQATSAHASQSTHAPTATNAPSPLPEGDNDPDCDDSDEPVTSSAQAHATTPTTFAHTIPATTVRNPGGLPTFSMPSISIPAAPSVPTFSMPNVPNGNGNVHVGTGSGSGSYGNGPGVHVSKPPATSGGPRRCPLTHKQRKAKRSLLEIESRQPTSPAEHVVRGGTARRLHFRKQFMRHARD